MRKIFYVMLLPMLLLGAERKVMIEVYTATWCSYCPFSSYGLDTLEMNYGDSIVVIKYHPSSSDPFFTPESIERTNYYGITGYPTAVFDGVHDVVGGWDGVYGVYLDTFLTRIVNPSPISIEMNVEFNSQNKDGKCYVVLTAESKLPDSTFLRYAIVEDSIHYNWQTRDILRHVLRKMIPNARGSLLNLGSGESLSDTIEFTLEDSWIEPYTYIIAFVQNDSTKEVLQANMVRIPVDYGKLALVSHRYSDSIGNNNSRLEPGDSAIFYFTITDLPPYATANWVHINISSDDPQIHIETPNMYIDSITVYDTITVSTMVKCTGGTTRFVNLFFEMFSDSGAFHSIDTLSIKIGFDSLIVWDGTQNKTLREYVLPYLNELGVSYDFHSQIDSGLPKIADAYKYIIYYSGNSTPSQEVISLLEEFMDSGINAFITGQNIASTQDSVFLEDYLRVRFLYDTTTDLLVIGTGNLFYPEDTVFLTSTGSAMNQYSKDVIEPLPGAEPILYYRKYNQSDSDTTAGLAYDDSTKRVVFFAFGYEGMGTLGTGKKEVLRRVLNYLGYSISNVREDERMQHLKNANTFLIFSSKIYLQDVPNTVFRIYSPSGRLTSHGYVHNNLLKIPRNLKNGVYFVEIGHKNKKTLKILLMR